MKHVDFWFFSLLVDDPATLGRLNEALEAVLNKAQVCFIHPFIDNIV